MMPVRGQYYMAKIGVGVVGLGRIFEDNHLPQISACPDMELVALADVTESRRDRWRTDINVPIYRTSELKKLGQAVELENLKFV